MRRTSFQLKTILTLALLTFALHSHADTSSALLAMEDSRNPLIRLSSSRGELYFELFPNEAPRNVERFIELAEGEYEFTNLESGETFQTRYYNGMRFHRVIPGFLIQAGSPAFNPLGLQIDLLQDEINADALGLDSIPALNADGSFAEMLNIESKLDLHAEILQPLYAKRNLESVQSIIDRQFAIAEELKTLSVKTVLENQGYRFDSSLQSRAIQRGTIALANSGPNTNGPEFFISLTDSPQLTGRFTVIGQLIEGVEALDNIAATAIEGDAFSSLSTLIYSIRRAN